MSVNKEHKKITDYFRSNIFESIAAYTTWKMLFLSKSKAVVSEDMANRYVEIQNYHSDFFGIVERSALVTFVILSVHSFDKRGDSYSLYKVDKNSVENFVDANKSTLENLKNLRHKLFAHRDNDADSINYQIPSVETLDTFFENLINFYNTITLQVDNSTTLFTNAYDVKSDIEELFQNLYRGEASRKREIDIDWMWRRDSKKASDIL